MSGIYQKVFIGDSFSKQQIFDIVVRHAFNQKSACLSDDGWPVDENEYGQKSFIACLVPPSNWPRHYDVSNWISMNHELQDKDAKQLLFDLYRLHNYCSQVWIDQLRSDERLINKAFTWQDFPMLFMGLALIHDLSPLGIWAYGYRYDHAFKYPDGGMPEIDFDKLLQLEG